MGEEVSAALFRWRKSFSQVSNAVSYDQFCRHEIYWLIRFALYDLIQELHSFFSHQLFVASHSSQRRIQIAGNHQIIQTDDGNVFRNSDAAGFCAPNGIDGKGISCAEKCSGEVRILQKLINACFGGFFGKSDLGHPNWIADQARLFQCRGVSTESAGVVFNWYFRTNEADLCVTVFVKEFCRAIGGIIIIHFYQGERGVSLNV